MCRNIKTLFNFEPPATKREIEAAAEQFVRKVSGFSKSSAVNEEAFSQAIKEISATTNRLMHHLETSAKPKNREQEAQRAHERAVVRFGS